MFIEEAHWLREHLAAIDLPAAGRALNLGSSTERYRTVEQPHNEHEVLRPLRERGLEIVNADVKLDEGVDVAIDLRDPELDLCERLPGPFDLVLVTGLLQHIPPDAVERVLAALPELVLPEGTLAITTPHRYRRTPDPDDYGYRPSPIELSRQLGCAFDVLEADSVRIDEPAYYRGIVSRSSAIPIGGTWLPLPGVSERLRRALPRWRWRETCLLAVRA